ncbi:sn-Glycerol-3-phosphate transport ATP-binding protein [Salmonella enterica subsp. enterica serovar Madelia]|nr:sn-Glycerol-3-phosphate transport ATP-binding protein [Salmonella enterica subsp. enterica serovar Madelia]
MAGLKLQAVTKSWDANPGHSTVNAGRGGWRIYRDGRAVRCGKSTLLRMVAGLERVTGGDIWIDRKRVTEMEPKDRGIAMVFQKLCSLSPYERRGEHGVGLKIRRYEQSAY